MTESVFVALKSVSDVLDVDVDDDAFRCALMVAQASKVESLNEWIVFRSAEGNILVVFPI